VTSTIFEKAVGVTLGASTAPVLSVTDWLGNVLYASDGSTTTPTPTPTPNPTPSNPDVTTLSSAPNNIRRLSVKWATPTAGNVRVRRTAGGITHTKTVAATVGQSSTGLELSEAYLSTATEVVVVAEAVYADGTYGPAATVTVPLSAGPVNRARPAKRTDLTRDPIYHPFTSTSPWNVPLPVTQTFEPVTSPATVSLRKETSATNGGWHASQGSDSHPINYAATGDPEVRATDRVYFPRSGSFLAPLGTVVSDDTANSYHDKHSHVFQPDGTTLEENYRVERFTQNRWDVYRRHRVDTTGSGIGPQNGTRAYGGSAIGGLIRAHEVEAKVIPHVVAWLVRADQLLRLWNPGGNYGYYDNGTFTTRDRSVADWCPDGWPLGTPRAGFSKGRGYVWPATEQDYELDRFTGNLPYGSLFAIPADVSLSSLGLTTEAGTILATAMQTYGGMLSDQGGDAGIQIEPGAPGWFRTQLIDNFKSTDIRKIIQACRVVSGNAPGSPGGRSLDAPRLAPLLPEIGPVVADTTAPTTTLTSPAAGSTTQRSTTVQGGYTDS